MHRSRFRVQGCEAYCRILRIFMLKVCSLWVGFNRFSVEDGVRKSSVWILNDTLLVITF
jgi:hypothetical protein